ncbi:Vgb family protein [Novosphingobium aquimarinum]|uniref:Vgb family protein n=1 Tax=Novosphingobium aquimarinum TaxID=2682494 RepID=UPI0012EBB772|nr:YncE family protein [Novosphingobium aquimarinum]
MMKPAIALVAPALFVAACSTMPPGTNALSSSTLVAFDEHIIKVPGFADFLTVDDDTVWTTNDGRIEQWSTSKKLATVSIPKPCGTMAMAFGSLWVANCDGGEVYRIDPQSAAVLARIPAGMGPSGELNVVAGAGSIWAPDQTAGTVMRIDPENNRVVAKVPVTEAASYLAFGFGALWAASGKGGTLQRIDPATNAVTHTITLGKTPGFLAAGEGAVWIQEQGDGTLARIDPDSVTVTDRIKVGDSLKWGDIDTGDGKVWLRTTDDQTFVVIDAATSQILARVGRPEGSGALRYTPNGIWTSAHDLQTLTWWSNAGD